MSGCRQDNGFVTFLKDLMARRRRLPSQLAADVGVSHVTVGRWLNGTDVPGVASCQRLATYSGYRIDRILEMAGHLSSLEEPKGSELPEFREYVTRKYPELDEDLIIMFEDLIERRRTRRLNGSTGRNRS
jgi:transcriptional regulator with XRE-family HTH domain